MPRRPWMPVLMVALLLGTFAPGAAPREALAQQPGTNGLIAWTDAGDIWVANPDGTGRRLLREGEWRVPGNGNALGLDWEPGGDTLAIEVAMDDDASPVGSRGEFHVIKADGTGSARIVWEGTQDTINDWVAVGFTPGAQRFGVLNRCTDTQCQHENGLVASSAGVSGLGPLTWHFRTPEYLNTDHAWIEDVSHIHPADPVWTPDGRALIMILPECTQKNPYVEFPGPDLPPTDCRDLRISDGHAIYRWGVGDPLPTMIHDLEGIEVDLGGDGSWANQIFALDVSPDGSKIVFDVLEADPPEFTEPLSDVWVVDMSGANARVLTSGVGGRARYPTWAPDGSSVIFSNPFGGIYSIPAAGGTPTELVAGVAADNIAWQCVGQSCLAPATIRIVKEVDALGGTFPATFNYSGSVSGSITHAGDPFAPPGFYYFETTAQAGSVSVTEALTAGWGLESITCSKPHTVSLATRTVTFTAEPAELVTCTFTSGAEFGPGPRGTVIVEKQTIPDGDPTQFSFTGAVTGTIGDGQTASASVAIGPQTISESAAAGWVLTDVTCDDPAVVDLANRTARVDVSDGETVRCVFTNTNDCAANPQADPVYCYAPQVRFHPLEEHFPMGTDAFVAFSKLMWAHDYGCTNSLVADQGDFDSAQLSGKSGEVFQFRQKTVRQSNPLRSCEFEGKWYRANEITRPGTDTKKKGVQIKPKGLAKGEGFYLDLNDDKHGGDAPNELGLVTTPLSYTYEPGEFVTYWFMYGYNPGSPDRGEYVDVHEGEWERISVLLDDDNRATEVLYFQHLCDPQRITWPQMTDGDPNNGRVVSGSRPVVYSALGAHASFPNIVNLGLNDGLCSLDGSKPRGPSGIGDITADGGAYWLTWTNLRNAKEQDWYGFGGAWGSAASHIPGDLDGLNVSGPLGPPCQDHTTTAVVPSACPRPNP